MESKAEIRDIDLTEALYEHILGYINHVIGTFIHHWTIKRLGKGMTNFLDLLRRFLGAFQC